MVKPVKQCFRCKEHKPIDGFRVLSASKDGRAASCKACVSKSEMDSYFKNHAERRDKFRQRRQENIEAVRAYDRERYPRIKASRILNKEKHDDYRREYERNRRASDPLYRVKRNLRVSLYQAVKRTKSSYRPMKQKLGIDISGLKSYLESKFQSGMSWDNYGQWHIDHIKPLCSFNLKNKSEYLAATHYTNLQPLWAKDNQRKHKKLEYNPSTSARTR